MQSYSVILEKFKGRSSRYKCPGCGKPNEFTRYKSIETGDYIADHVGRCNREVHCGYHYTPKQYFEDNKHSIDFARQTKQLNPKFKPVEPARALQYLPNAVFEKTMSNYDRNNFYMFLISLFGDSMAKCLAERYCIGTSRRWPGANIFWQVDVNGNLRQAKIMQYNPTTGRRVKDDGDKVYFGGKKILNDYDANLLQCFYGEGLLTLFPKSRVAIVESEKTAIIASVYFPDFIWLATGGSHGCRWTQYEVCKVLEGREVILFPDLGFYEKWKEKSEQVRKLTGCKIAVSNILEREEDQKGLGLDLADYLLMNRDQSGLAMTTEGYPLMWDIES